MMAEIGMRQPDRLRVSQWFEEHSWCDPVIRDAHRPFPGAMAVIGWLQAQEKTFVALNTGRSESMRKETLQCLNKIGRPHGAVFQDRLLFHEPQARAKASLNRR